MPSYEDLKDNKSWLEGCRKSRETQTKQHQERIDRYNQNPIPCANETCGNFIPYQKSLERPAPKYCCRSCSSIANNKGRRHSDEVKSKIRLKVIANGTPLVIGSYCGIAFKKCRICGKSMCTSISNPRIHCSDECTSISRSTHAKKIGLGGNFNSKSCWYESPAAGRVHLDSSYELRFAQLLDENEINWVRPRKGLEWIDWAGGKHKYYPDFHLPEISTYVDTKNDYLIQRHRYKLRVVQKTHNIKLIILDLPQINLEVLNCILERTYEK